MRYLVTRTEQRSADVTGAARKIKKIRASCNAKLDAGVFDIDQLNVASVLNARPSAR